MTYEELLDQTRALLNDQDAQVATNAVLLPYLNLALAETQELFGQNNVPITNETSAVIEVPSGTSVIGFPPDPVIPDTPYLPADLLEIQRVWYSNSRQNNWFPVLRRDFLTGDMLGNNTEVGYFGVWAWMNQELRVLAANADLDLKLDYIQKLFNVLDVDDLDEDLTVINVSTWLSFRIAGLVAEFIDENPTRAQSLNIQGLAAMDRALGISTKGRQAIVTRRRPFRAAWKMMRRNF